MRYQISLLIALFLSSSILVNAEFSDVDETTTYKDAIEYTTDKGIVNGDPGNTFRPYDKINRAEFTKIIISTIYSDEEIDSCDTSILSFTDVKKDDWYEKYICIAFRDEIVHGYLDGTFGPEKYIWFSEATKIIVLSFGFEVEETTDQTYWYEPYTEVLTAEKTIPTTIQSFSQSVRRFEVAEMIYRLDSDIVPENYMVLYDNYLINFNDHNQEIGHGFYINESGVFRGNFKYISLNTETVEVLAETYVKDKNAAFFFKEDSKDPFDISGDSYFIIIDADTETFEALNDVYAKDKNQVYYHGEPFTEADPETFELVDMITPEFEIAYSESMGTLERDQHLTNEYFLPRLAYAKDKNNIYYENQILDNIDPDTFVAYAFIQYMSDAHPVYARDEDSIIFKSEKVENVDTESWEILDYLYQKDKNHIYFENQIVEDADLESFKVINSWDLAEDNNHSYQGAEIIVE